MQQVKAWLEQAVKACNIRLTDAPVLLKHDFRPPLCRRWSMTLRPHPARAKSARKKCVPVKPILKRGGYCHAARSFLPHGGPRKHQPLYV